MTANFSLAQIVVLAVVLISSLTQSTAADVPFRVGIASVMSGPLSHFGRQMVLGAEQAAKSLNPGVELVTVDDECDGRKAREAAKYLIDKMSVDVVIGHPCNAAALAAAPIYADRRVPFLTFSTTPQLQMAGSEGRFRLCGREDSQVEIMTRHVLAELAPDRVGRIIPSQSQTTTNPSLGFDKQISEIDDPKSLVARFAEGQVEAVIVAGATIGRMMRLVEATRNADLNVAFIQDEWSTSGINSRGLQEAFWDGTVMNSNCYVPLDLQRHAADIGVEFEGDEISQIGYAVPTIAAMQIVAGATQFIGTRNLEDLATDLQSKQFDTAMGKVAFDDSGELLASTDGEGDLGPYVYGWYMVENGVMKTCTSTNPW